MKESIENPMSFLESHKETDEDVKVLLAFYDKGRASGGFEAGIELAIQRTLVSPSFLFRTEFPPDSAATPGSCSPAMSAGCRATYRSSCGPTSVTAAIWRRLASAGATRWR